MSLVQVTSANADKNLAGEVSVLAWTAPNRPGLAAELAFEIRAGDGAKNLAGGGVYVVRAVVASQEAFRAEVYVAVGVTRRTFWCPSIPIRQAEVLTIYLTGLAADSDVDVTVILHDRTEDQAIGRAELGVGRCWFVDGAYGADANSGGSWLSAKATIAAGAMGAAGFASGDGIFVAPGTYAEHIATGGFTAITLRGSGWKTIVQAAVAVADTDGTIQPGADWRIEDLKVVNTAGDGNGYEAIGSAAAPRVRIRNVWAVAADSTPIFLTNSPDARVENCLLEGRETGVLVDGGGAGAAALRDLTIRLAGWSYCNAVGISLQNLDSALIERVQMHVECSAPSVFGGALGIYAETVGVVVAREIAGEIDGTAGATYATALAQWAGDPVQWLLSDSRFHLTAGGAEAASLTWLDQVGGRAAVKGVDHGTAALWFGTQRAFYAPPSADILADTDELQASGVKLSNQGKTDVTGAVPTAAAIGTDAASKVLATPAQKLATDESGRVTAGSVADKTGYALATAPPTKAEISGQVKTDLDAAHGGDSWEGGGTGATPEQVAEAIAAADIPGALATAHGAGSWTAADVWAVGARTLTSFGTLVADVTAGVWNALLSGYELAGSFGKTMATILAKVNLIGTSTFAVTSPVATDGTITITRGDDYSGDTILELDVEDYAGPSIAGKKAVDFGIGPLQAGRSVKVTGVATAEMVDTTLHVEVALTEAQTSALKPGLYRWDVQITLSDDRKYTPFIGTLVVMADVTP